MWLNGIKNSAILIGMTLFIYIPFMLSCLILITTATKITSFVSQARKVKGTKFWEIPPMEAAIKLERYLVPRALNYSPIATQRTPLVTHEWKMRGMLFEENCSDESRNTTEKVLCSPSKVPLIIHRPQPNVCRFHSIRGKCEV
jgi:hypothetical protein